MCNCNETKIIHSYEPRLIDINRKDRSLHFKIEGTDVEGIFMSTNSLIRYTREDLISFNDWAVIVMCKLNGSTVEIINANLYQPSKTLAWADNRDIDFIFAFKSGNQYDDSFTNKNGNQLNKTINTNYAAVNLKEVIDDFKFNLTSGFYNHLFK